MALRANMPKATSEMIHIQCTCHAVTISITGDPVAQVYCHCGDCRTASNEAYTWNAIYPAEAVALVDGNLSVHIVKTAPRFQCAICKTNLFTEITSLSLRSVNARLMPSELFDPECHIQCQHALAPVPDSLPHLKGFPLSFGGSDDIVEW